MISNNLARNKCTGRVHASLTQRRGRPGRCFTGHFGEGGRLCCDPREETEIPAFAGMTPLANWGWRFPLQSELRQPAGNALRAWMIVAPVARCVEAAGPDAEATLTGRGFFGAVAARRDGQSLPHHGGADVAAANKTRREQPIILIDILGAAIGRAGGKQLRHAVTRRPAAGPRAAVGVSAVLRQFGRVEAKQPNTIAPQPEAVAITDPPAPRDRRRRLIDRGRNHGQHGKNGNDQQRPSGATNDAVSIVLSTQDFTAR